MSEFVLAKKSDMVALADALRELSGGTEELSFPGEMVAAIEAGGGNIVYGTVTPATTGSCVTLTHDLGVIPTVGIWCRVNSADITSTSEVLALYQPAAAEGCRIYAYNSSGSISASRNVELTYTIQSYYFNRATTTTVMSPKYVVSGNTYFWAVMV